MSDPAMEPAAVLDAIVKAYDVRGLVPSQLDPAAAEAIGSGFAEFAGAPVIAVGRIDPLESHFQLQLRQRFHGFIAYGIAFVIHSHLIVETDPGNVVDIYQFDAAAVGEQQVAVSGKIRDMPGL